MLFVSRNRRVLICTATAWVVNIALTNFDHTTVPVNPLKSCTSTCSGLFSISFSLIPLSLYKKMSKGGEEGPQSTFVLHCKTTLCWGFESSRKQKVHNESSSFISYHYSRECYRAFHHSKGSKCKKEALHLMQERRMKDFK